MLDTEFETIQEGYEKLEKAVSTRDQMGGALYWNICSDDCLVIAGKLMRMGGDMKLIQKIMN